MPLSEQDLHQLFAEAVLAGKPGSTGPIEITTGVASVSYSQKIQPAWASNPVMSHFIQYNEKIDPDRAIVKHDIPVKTQLAQARTKAEVSDIVNGALIPKLCALFHLRGENFVNEDLNNVDLSAMGTDSLLAIDIRSWFMSVFQVNIPVLKILSGLSVRELVEMAADCIPLAFVPRLQADYDSSFAQSQVSESDNLQNSSEDNMDAETQSDPDGSYKTQLSSTSSIIGCINRGQASIVQTPAFQETAKLSFSQSMFWFVLMFLDDKTSLNHTGSFRLTGRIDYGEFEKALQAIGLQHASLRTCFFEKNGQPMQGVMQSSTLRGEYRQISSNADVAQAVNELERHDFDPERGETMRILLLSLSPTTHFLVLGTHSLIMDGWSFQVFLTDLERHYTNAARPFTTPQFFDYSIQEHKDFEHGKFDSELAFWKTELAAFPPPLPILHVGAVASHPPLTTYENERVDIKFKSELKARIQVLCRNCRATPFHFYLAVFRVLLLRYADAKDVSVGIADANRISEGTVNGIGSFVNLLPLHFHAEGTARFEDLLKETRDKAYAALANARVPFQVLLKE
ncbi:hypothetical protein DL770_002748 [Monosporascus sp. CRB-9-2]|nr:hypothetical protein DL770_002748 [Monosporascus sp. CRB-9-2]